MKKIILPFILSLSIAIPVMAQPPEDSHMEAAKEHHKMAEEKRMEAEKHSPDMKAHHEAKPEEHRERAKAEEALAEHHDELASEAKK